MNIILNPSIFLTEISMGESWSGRICCPLPQSVTCRTACVTAASHQDLSNSCRRSDEIAFYGCLERQSLGESCCGHARSDDCKDACTDIFRSHLTPSKQQRQLVFEQCENTSPKVLNCVKNFTKVTPATNSHKRMIIFSKFYRTGFFFHLLNSCFPLSYPIFFNEYLLYFFLSFNYSFSYSPIHFIFSFLDMKCCDKSNKSKCRESCVRALSKSTTMQEIIDELHVGGCGPPLLQVSKIYWIW